MYDNRKAPFQKRLAELRGEDIHIPHLAGFQDASLECGTPIAVQPEVEQGASQAEETDIVPTWHLPAPSAVVSAIHRIAGRS